MASHRIPERDATPEEVFLSRRKLLKGLGLASLWPAGLWSGCGHQKTFEPYQDQEPATPPSAPQPGGASPVTPVPAGPGLYPAPPSQRFATLDRPLTEESAAARYNNFYEFSPRSDEVWQLAWMLKTHPWTVEVAGLVSRPRVYDIDDLVRTMPLEERLYRFRCVEPWAMAVPWTGFPMSALVSAVEPSADARFVRFTSFFAPESAPGQWDNPDLAWPYSEGLAIEEATNELTLLATGIYGHPLPEQHGAPLRLVVPWKYGYKSIKSIARIEFVSELPATFWNTMAPNEYGFWANVDPGVPHPRWSQVSEELLGTGERRPTLRYNGYGEFAGPLYG